MSAKKKHTQYKSWKDTHSDSSRQSDYAAGTGGGRYKKILILSIVLGLILVVGGLVISHMEKNTAKAPLPDNAETCDIIGSWSTAESDGTAQSMTFEFSSDGDVTGTIAGKSFKGTWGEEDDVYHIYNSKGRERYTAQVDGNELSLESVDVSSSASNWTLLKSD